MKLINQSHEILNISDDILKCIERAGRTCYKSEDKITPDSAEKFVKTLINRGHHAMIEFGHITVKFITNRGVTHELVRHRLCSFAQESTRYVRYDGEMEFIIPTWLHLEQGHWGKVGNYILPIRNRLLCSDAIAQYGSKMVQEFLRLLIACESSYRELLSLAWQPQQAREVLPNALKTEIVVKANIREWRHIFKLRCSKTAHPQMRALMLPLLAEFKEKIPVVFDDI